MGCFKGTYDEQALPAYTNPNPLMRWLFWQRIKAVLDFLDTIPHLDTVLDFGCGPGVMLPYLNRRAIRVFAIDLDTTIAEKFASENAFIEVIFSQSIDRVLNGYAQSCDAILALDVLEHINNINEVLQSFVTMLKPGGFLIVTGPTENLIYRIGRWLAGYSGEYHQRNIYDINKVMQKYFQVSTTKTLVPLVPLFILYTGQV